MPWCVIWAATTTVNAHASLKGMLTGKAEELWISKYLQSSFNPRQTQTIGTLNKTPSSSLKGDAALTKLLGLLRGP